MKKNFFKKLSFVMASAMLITAIAPAAGANAATSPALTATKKYLHLSGVSGPSEYDFNVKNKVSGWKYAWSSANKSVAAVDKVGLTTAAGVGSTKVTVKITKDGKKVKDLSATVVVRDNIETVTVANAPEKALKVNEVYDFNRNFVTEAGSTTKTSSITRWSVDKATATIDAAGKFVATEAGEYKVTAMSFQSAEKYENWKTSKDVNLVLDTDEVTVKVAPTMTVAQTDLDSIKLTFDSVMTDVAKNLSLYTLVGTTEVKVTTAKPLTMSADKKSATIDFYVPLAQGATYVVKYDGIEPVTFVAAKAEVDKVAKVVVKTTEAVINVATPVEVQLFDANNVDITNTELSNRVTLASSSNRVYYDGSSKSVVIFTKGETTTITATYHTYKYEAGKEIGNIEGAGTIVGVDAASTVVGGVKAWTLLAASTTSPSFTDVKQVLAVKEEKKLFVQLNTTTGSTTATVDNSTLMGKFSFESSDKTTLIIDNVTGILYPVKAGSVAVVVKYDGKAVDVINITIGAERTATNLVLGKSEVSVSNTSLFADTDKVSVKVKDQYGDDVAIVSGDITLEKLAGSPASTIASVVGTDVVINGTGATKGLYYYKVTAKNKVAYVTVNVLEPAAATTTSTYTLQLGGTEVDSKSTADNATPSISIDLFELKGGVKYDKLAVTGDGFNVYVKDPDGKETQLTTVDYKLYTLSGNAITPIKNGTYTVTAKYATGTASGIAVSVQYFTVKNTQAKPTFELKNGVYTATTLNGIATECFKVIFDGKEVAGVTMGETIGSVGSSVYVKSLKWTETIGSYTIEHTIDVNLYVEKK